MPGQVLTDSDIAGLPDPAAGPTAQPTSMPYDGQFGIARRPDGTIASAYTGTPRQTSDPAQIGSILAQVRQQQPQQPAPLTDAQVAAMPQAAPTPEGKPDFGTGFAKGVSQPWDNLGTWYRDFIRAVPGESSIDTPTMQVMDTVLKQQFGPAYRSEGDVKGDKQALADALMQGKTPGFWGNAVGNAVSTAPIYAAVRSPALGGALSGALSTDNPNDPAAVATDAAIGGAGGKLGQMGTNLLANALSPVVRPAVQTLTDLGTKLTPGQILGGTTQRIEDALTHLPVVGDMIKSAQHQSLTSFNTGAINDRALAPIGETLPPGTQGRLSGYRICRQ